MSEVIGSQLTSEMVELVRRPDYRQYGRFLDVHDLESLLAQTDFDSAKHLRHARGWRKADR